MPFPNFRKVATRIATEALNDLPPETTYNKALRALDLVSPIQKGNMAELRIWSEVRKKAMRDWRLSRQSNKPDPPALFGSPKST